MMEKLKRLSKKWRVGCVLALALCSSGGYANYVKQADELYAEAQYQEAYNMYIKGATEARAKAYYQLGVINYKGLGRSVDELKALQWFALAAELDYLNSAEIVEGLLGQANQDSRELLARSLTSLKNKLNRLARFSQFMPLVNQQNIATPTRFGEETHLDPAKFVEDIENLGLDTFMSDFDPETGEMTEMLDAQDYATPFYLIAEYDIAPDGSVRNVTAVQHDGDVRRAVFDLQHTSMPAPHFKTKKSLHTAKSYLGMASANKYRMKSRFPKIYRDFIKTKRQLVASDKGADKYKLAMMLDKFPWLLEQDDDVIEILRGAATTGYANAKYALGFKLYQQQIDHEEGIKWMSEAAQEGVKQAQYRIGWLMLNSPYVERNESNALFWFDEAADQNHHYAKLQAAKIQLTAEADDLLNVKSAKQLLNQVESTLADDPEFQYLTAIYHAKKTSRELFKSVQHMRKAISLGEDLNWDVTDWQAQLERWTNKFNIRVYDLEEIDGD